MIVHLLISTFRLLNASFQDRFMGQSLFMQVPHLLITKSH